MSTPTKPNVLRIDPAVAIVGAVTILVVGAILLTHDPIYLYNDAFQHVSATRSITSGDGYATSIVYYDQNYAQQSIPVPQTVWPPGIAALSSVFVILGFDAITAVFLVSVLGILLCPIFAMLTARSLALSQTAELLVSLSTIGLGLLIYITLRAGTEGPFLAATLVALAGAARLSRRPDSIRAALLMIAIGTTLAVSIRYNGLFLVVSTGCWFLFNAITRRSLGPFIHGVISLTPAALVGGGILIRNMLYTGSLTGGPVSETWASPAAVARALVEAGVSTVGMNPSQPIQLLLLLLLAAAVGLTVIAIVVYLSSEIRGSSESAPGDRANRDVLVFCLFYMLVSMLMLVIVLAPRALDALGYRYLLPLVPFWVCSAAIVWRRREQSMSAGVSRILQNSTVRQMALSSTVVLLLIGNGLAFARSWQAMANDEALAEIPESLDSTLVGGTPLRERLEAAASSNSPILSSSSQRLGGLTGWPVLGLTPGSYSLSEWGTDNVHEVVREYGVCYVLLHRSDTESRTSGGRQFFAELRSGQVPSWLRLYAQSDLLTVYEVTACQTDEP